MNPNPIQSDMPENEKSPFKWDQLVRRFLSQQNRIFLEQAIREVKKGNELEIADYLQALADNRMNKVYSISEYLIPKLSRVGRHEESLVVELTSLHAGTLLIDLCLGYPYDERERIRELGIETCRQAIQISQSLGDKPCQAMYLGKLANAFADSRQLPEAEYFNNQAVQLYRDCIAEESPVFLKDLVMTLNNLGNAQSDLRKLAEAEISYTEALELKRKLAEQEPDVFLPSVAITLNNLGTIQSEQRKLAKAEESYTEALKIRQKLADREPHLYLPSVATTLNNLGSLFWEQKKFAKTGITFVEGLKIYRKLVEREPQLYLPPMATMLNNLGILQWEQKNLTEAEISYVEALKIRRELAEQEPHIFLQDVAITLNNLGVAQSDQRKLTEAEISYAEALEIYQELAEREPYIFLQSVAITHNNLGTVQSDQRKLVEAEISYVEALKIRRELAEREPHIFLQDVSITLNNLGIIQSELMNWAEAEGSYTEALEIRRKLAEYEPHIFLQDVAMTLNNLGIVQNKQWKVAEAEKSYSESLQIRRDLALREPHIFNQDIAITLNNLGYLQLEENRLAEARNNFESARGLIEDLRTKAITIDDRNRMMQGNTNVYSNLLDCYIRMDDWKKALEIAEQGKSRSLSDLLNLKSEDLQPKAPTHNALVTVKNLGRKYSDTIKELQRIESYERYLSEQISQLENAVKRIKFSIKNDDAAQPGSLQQMIEEKRLLDEEKQKVLDQRFAVQAELKKVLGQIRKYDKDFPPRAREIGNEEILEIAKDLNRTIVIFRVLSRSTAVIFVFPNGKLKIETVSTFGQNNLFELFYHDWLIPYQQWKKSGTPLQNVKEASFQISQSPETGAKDWLLLIEKTLDTIYEKLMIHIHRVLKLNSPTTEVLFIPSQSLAVLPLHAASWNKDGEKHYLLEEFTISYCPSVSVFKRCQKNEKERTDKTLLINNPTGDLRFSEKEVEAIKKIYQPNTDLRRKKATKSTVFRALKDNYGIMHFACHGFYKSENQFDSGLVMSNGVIELSEIINCNLQNNWLTTLSACETGVVDFASPTDEHFGLPLGFIFAGSPSVWASLWSVSDETTSLLMQEAYQNLSKKEFYNNKPESLRQAQLSILRKFSSPYYWAGFQHYGI